MNMERLPSTSKPLGLRKLRGRKGWEEKSKSRREKGEEKKRKRQRDKKE